MIVFAPRCPKQHYLQETKGGNDPKVRRWINGETKWDIRDTTRYY